MLSVAATELVSGVSGDTESKIRELFETARVSAPCILFIDGKLQFTKEVASLNFA